MESPVEELRSELLQCPVCLSEMVRPRALRCLHSFCESCIERHAENYRAMTRCPTNYFPCPTCRVVTLLPPEGIPGLSKDFRMERISDALKGLSSEISKQQQQQQQQQSSCNLCALSSMSNREAATYCMDCCKNLCASCSESHHRKPLLASHNLLKLPKTSILAAPPGEEACALHHSEPESFRCNTCERNLCIVCLSSHEDDHHVENRKDSGAPRNPPIYQLAQQLQDQLWHIQRVMFRLTVLEGKLRGTYDESKLQIRKKSRKLMARILSEENKLLENLDKTYHNCSSNIVRQREECKSQITELENLQNRIYFLLMFDDGHDKVREVYPSLQGKMETLQAWLHSLESNLENTSDFVKFTPSQSSVFLGALYKRNLFENPSPQQSSVVRPSMPVFGEEASSQSARSSPLLTDVIEPVYAKSPISNPKVVKPENTSQESSFSICRPNLTLLSRFGNSGTHLGEYSLPYNICFLKDDTIVVADLGNKRLQLVDKYGHCHRVIATGEIIPRSVTTTADDTIAITDEQDKTMKVFSPSGAMLTNLHIDSLSFPYGIATTTDRSFVITDMIYESISIISSMGRVILRFGSHGRSDNCLDNPGCVFVDDTDTIFVSDTGNHCVKVFSKTGRFLYKIGSYGSDVGQLKYPKAVTMDQEGHLFVADSGNDRVVAFTRMGISLGTAVTKESGLRRPTGIACNQRGDLLAVSMPDPGEIRLYEIGQGIFAASTKL